MNCLLVPVRIDALLRRDDLHGALAPFADFSGLPWLRPVDGLHGPAGDVEADTAFTSQNVLNPPFADEHGVLERGVHLHWALPHALSMGRHARHADGSADGQRLQFPRVPDRWLVVRSAPGRESRRWIVESDYLWPPDTPWAPGRISFPVAARHIEGTQAGLVDAAQPPWRYLGRCWELGSPPAPVPGESRLETLLASGYGEPAFNAFYPCCRGVFGFHDALDDAPQLLDRPDGLGYELFGWYADAADDELRLRRASGAARAVEQLGWRWKPGGAGPERTLCFGRLSLATQAADGGGPPAGGAVAVVLANTGTEALSAHLARELAAHASERSGDGGGSLDAAAVRCRIEHQLESLHLGDALQGLRLDLGMRLFEARHDKTFHAVPGGSTWTLVPRAVLKALPVDAPSAPAAVGAGAARPPAEPAADALPPQVASAIGRINRLQQRVDRAAAEIASLRRQIYADWHKYITCCYHPDAAAYPHPDQIRAHIEAQIAALDARLAELGDSPPTDTGDGAAGSLQRQLAQQLGGATALLAALAAVGCCARAQRQAAASGGGALQPEAAAAARALEEALAALVASWPEAAAGLLARRGAASAARLARIPDLVLARAPAPRYWQPNDPVLLLVGPGVQRSDRHDGAVLACEVVCGVDLGTAPAAWGAHPLDLRVRAALGDASHDSWPCRDTAGDPWHPIALEWEVAFESPSAHLVPDRRRHDPGLLANGFRLGALAVEALSPIGDPAPPAHPPAATVRGRAILGAHAGRVLEDRLDSQLRAALRAWLLAAVPVPADPDPDELLRTAPVALDDGDADAARRRRVAERAALDALLADDARSTAFLDWCESRHVERHGCRQAGGSSMRTMLQARALLRELDGKLQSQALGGFHEALLMQEEVLQFDPVDPLGFPELRHFSERIVRDAVRGHAHTAPVPHADFHPLRSGALRVQRLRLVDSFGRALPLPATVHTTHQLDPVGGGGDHLQLPPRITQPARLDLRWLSSADDAEDCNPHPLTTPVCGWLVANHLDGSLALHDRPGALLGAVGPDGRWRAAAGRSGPAFPAAIGNPRLARLARWFEAQGRRSGWVSDFLDLVDGALECIDPEGHEQHRARALLTGRPLAVVRLALRFELLGLPARDQSWDALRDAIAGGTNDPSGFLAVRLPVRIGEHGKLNDGVVGFWVDGGDDDKHGPFHAAQQHGAIAARVGAADSTLWRSLADDTLRLTLLLDPRAALHATTGLLPTQALRLPREHYAAALASLQASFLVSPLLTPPARTEIPLPDEPGSAWSWLQRDGSAWTERGRVPAGDPRESEGAAVLAAAPTDARFGAAAEIREGWLRLVPNPQEGASDG